MDNLKLSAILYMAAGVVFFGSAFLGGNMVNIALGAVFVVLGLRKLKESQE